MSWSGPIDPWVSYRFSPSLSKKNYVTKIIQTKEPKEHKFALFLLVSFFLSFNTLAIHQKIKEKKTGTVCSLFITYSNFQEERKATWI